MLNKSGVTFQRDISVEKKIKNYLCKKILFEVEKSANSFQGFVGLQGKLQRNHQTKKIDLNFIVKWLLGKENRFECLFAYTILFVSLLLF